MMSRARQLVIGVAAVLFLSAPAFGQNTPSTTIQMWLDDPGVNQTLAWPLQIRGWAIDTGAPSGIGVDAVHIYAYPDPGSGTPPVFLGAAVPHYSRPDVGAVFGDRFTNAGFLLDADHNDMPIPAVPPGRYEIVAYARSTVSGSFDLVRSSLVTVVAAGYRPVGSIDSPYAAVGARFIVSGWALNTATAGDDELGPVHVYAVPDAGGPALFLGETRTVLKPAIPRPDVGVVYGWRFLYSGYQLTVSDMPAGEYTLVVYARSAQQWFPMTTHLSVHQAGTPFMAIDTPLDGTVVGSGQPFVVSGWAIDYDHASNRGTDAIHVWAVPVSGGSPIFAGGSLLGDARPDVTAAFGSQFVGAGYHVVVNGLSPGQYYIAVYAHSTVSDTFQSRVVLVTVQ